MYLPVTVGQTSIPPLLRIMDVNETNNCCWDACLNFDEFWSVLVVSLLSESCSNQPQTSFNEADFCENNNFECAAAYHRSSS